MHDARRDRDEGAGASGDDLAAARADAEAELAREDEEGVHVAFVEVRSGAALPRLVPRLRRVEQRVRAGEDDVPLLAIGDDLAPARSEEHAVCHVELHRGEDTTQAWSGGRNVGRRGVPASAQVAPEAPEPEAA